MTLSSMVPSPPRVSQTALEPVKDSQRVSPTRRSFRRRCRTCQLPCNHCQSSLWLGRAHPGGSAVDAAAAARVARNCRRSMCRDPLSKVPPSLRVPGGLTTQISGLRLSHTYGHPTPAAIACRHPCLRGGGAAGQLRACRRRARHQCGIGELPRAAAGGPDRDLPVPAPRTARGTDGGGCQRRPRGDPGIRCTARQLHARR